MHLDFTLFLRKNSYSKFPQIPHSELRIYENNFSSNQLQNFLTLVYKRIADRCYFLQFFQTSTDVTNWPTLNETPRSNPTPTSANPKSKNNTTPKSEVETSSVNGEISKTENESSQGEQAPDGSKENQQNSSKNKKKKGKNLFFL